MAKLSELQIRILSALDQGSDVYYFHPVRSRGWYAISRKDGMEQVRGASVNGLETRKLITIAPHKAGVFRTQYVLTELGRAKAGELKNVER